MCVHSFLRHTHTQTYHEGEGFGGDGLVVRVYAVPHTHFHLSLLHSVPGGVVQSTHNPAGGGRRTGVRERNANEYTDSAVFYCVYWKGTLGLSC